MKKKILSLFLIGALSLSMVACGNTSTNNKDNTNNEETSTSEESIDTSDINVNIDDKVGDLSYYYAVYTSLDEFYEGFYLINDSMDDMDSIEFNAYREIMNNAYTEVKDMKVPSKYSEAHTYLISSFGKYIQGVDDSFEAILDGDYESYNTANDLIVEASNELSLYSSEIEDDFSSAYNLVNALVQNEYYFNTIEVFAQNSDFTDNENESLWILEKAFCGLPNLRKALLDAAIGGESTEKAKQEFEDLQNTIENLDIENDNIATFRDEELKEFELYKDYLFEVADLIESNEHDDDTVNDYANKLFGLNYDIFVAMQGVSDFYAEYDYDIGFESALEDASSTIQTSIDDTSSEDEVIEETEALEEEISTSEDETSAKTLEEEVENIENAN